MKTVEKIVNNLLNENIFALNSVKGQLIKKICVIFGDNQFMSKHTFHIQYPSIYTVSIGLVLVSWHPHCENSSGDLALSSTVHSRYNIVNVLARNHSNIWHEISILTHNKPPHRW